MKVKLKTHKTDSAMIEMYCGSYLAAVMHEDNFSDMTKQELENNGEAELRLELVQS